MSRIIVNVQTGEVQVDTQYVNTNPTVPDEQHFPELTARRFWKAALAIGVTEDDVVALLADAPDKEELEIDVRKATSFWRSDPLVEQLSALKGIPPEQLDALWMWASTL